MEIMPPHDIPAEQRLIAAALIEEGLFRRTELHPDQFYQKRHSMIWVLMAELSEINLVTVSDILERKGQLEEIGGISYLTEICLPAVIAPMSDVKIIKDKALRRMILKKSLLTIQGINSEDIETLVSDLRIHVDSDIQIVSARETSVKTIKYIDELQKSDSVTIGLSSGFDELDRKTGGFRPGELIIIAARPGMGKSILKGNIALQSGKPVGIFEIEMALEQNGLRYISSIGEIDHDLIRLGKLNMYEYRKAINAAAELAVMPIHQVFEYSVTVEKIRNASARMVDNYGVKGILIDYMQLIKPSKGAGRERQIAHMAVSLKGLARELNIPVICLAQLNRACELRSPKNPVPMLSDLRESGSIEQDADMVIFLYRDDYYAKLQKRTSEEPGIARLMISKARNSQTGNVRLQWEGKFMKFKNLERNH